MHLINKRRAPPGSNKRRVFEADCTIMSNISKTSQTLYDKKLKILKLLNLHNLYAKLEKNL